MRWTTACAIATLLFAPAWADTIHLKSGGVLAGKITAESESSVTIELAAGGVVTLSRQDIESIERGPAPQDEFQRRLDEAVAAGDAGAVYGVGLWAQEQGLRSLARHAFERAITIDPNHEGARRALGYVRYKGEWLTREEAYMAMGLVRVGDRWMTEAEALLERERQLERERRETERVLARERAREERARALREAYEAEQARSAPPAVYHYYYYYGYPPPATTVVYVPASSGVSASYGNIAYHFHAKIGGTTIHFFSPHFAPQHGYFYWPY
jgi:tetratricopeptide (TPR) repeat protein